MQGQETPLLFLKCQLFKTVWTSHLSSYTFLSDHMVLQDSYYKHIVTTALWIINAQIVFNSASISNSQSHTERHRIEKKPNSGSGFP